MLKDQACIVGIGETAYTRDRDSTTGTLALQLQASVRAAEDAGLGGHEIGGFIGFH